MPANSSNNSNDSNLIAHEILYNNEDRLANILFILGVSFGLRSTDVVEQLLTLNQEKKLSTQEQASFLYHISKMLASANEVYLLAGIIFLYTAFSRFINDKNTQRNPTAADKERLAGRGLVTAGNLFKVIGYSLSATGNEMIAQSTQTIRNP